MSFLCPKCAAEKRTLSTIEIIELPSDARSDEITLQVLKCSQCSFSGIAVYEETRRVAIDQDSFSQIGYIIDRKDLNKIRDLIRMCPEPRNPRCDCQTHKMLGKKDSRAYWIGIKEIPKSDNFRLDL